MWFANFKEEVELFEKYIDEIMPMVIHNISLWAKDKTFVVGMSGGIDCAVAAALVLKAGGKVIGITMPYHKEESQQRIYGIAHAKLQCEAFGIPLIEKDISAAADELIDFDHSMASANVLPRVRMTYLYHYAQAHGAYVLGTGNLSEYQMGYFTKWGDGGYDFNPLIDFPKTMVFILAKYLGVIPEILNKKPSADLWDGQTDEEEIGVTYEDIDKFVLFHDDELEEEVKDIILEQYRTTRHKRPEFYQRPDSYDFIWRGIIEHEEALKDECN